MIHTELSKKQRGSLRYARQQARYRLSQANKSHVSDYLPTIDLMNGVSGKAPPQTEFVSRFPAPRPKAMSYNMFELLLNALEPKKKEN